MASSSTAFRVPSGFSLNDNIFIFDGTVDPTTAFTDYGIPPAGSLYLKTNDGTAYIKTDSIASSWAQLIGSSTPQYDIDLFLFGAGNDGDATLTTGTTTLTRDWYYHNLTMSGSAVINTAGFRLFVSGTLDLTGLTTGILAGRFQLPPV